MRESASRMAELEFEAPLAQIEDADDCLSTADFPQKTINGNDIKFNNINNLKSEIVIMKTDSNKINDNDEPKPVKCKQDNMQNGEGDNFTETFSGSLEDLVNTFDEKITKCFGNYEESVEKLAPVQVRSQEEIMNECQMWWTITGNFGNILPIDWTKSFSRKMHIPTLNLSDKKSGYTTFQSAMTPDDEIHSSEDEAVASDLDMHALILGGLHQDHECPVKTADEVIQEIDDMMQETPSSEGDIIEYNEALEKGKEVLSSPLYEDKLRHLSLAQLNEIFMELEVLIREFSETLIAELAHRDELEYEKELKNTFISLLLAVQNKRRQYHIEKKKRSGPQRSPSLSVTTTAEPKYLTTVIPFHLDNGPPDNQSLQVLIKILKAINEDSPTVPTLLTDYILKVLCPT
ncbi:fasciculation and elongation protein zeta-2 isoform X1 [Colias croceus]|uniref:fasciculation and elongation protein zeta-2 isoform X1 n=1 Tax=Colias crocea TaxID=72248 RepID=UPI001E28026D|nr:fasciculation and elongation protein zeta-2 isoform X1 [Colias croceus]